MNKQRERSRSKTPSAKVVAKKSKEEKEGKDKKRSISKPKIEEKNTHKTPSRVNEKDVPKKTGEKPKTEQMDRKKSVEKSKTIEKTKISKTESKSPKIQDTKKSLSASKKMEKNLPPQNEKKEIASKNIKINKSAPKSEGKNTKESRIKTKIIKKYVTKTKKIKEEEGEEGSQVSSDKKEEQKKSNVKVSQSSSKRKSQQFNYEDSKGISDEIEKIIKKIEDKKKSRNSGGNLLGKKTKRSNNESLSKKRSKDYNYVLKKNPNVHCHHLIDLENLAKKNSITATEVILAIIECAYNSSYYLFDFSPKSIFFWEDVIEYKTLSKIFGEYKPGTLKKYWGILSKYDAIKTGEVLEKNKAYLDSIQEIKLGTIITAVEKYFEGAINSIENYINSIEIVESRKHKTFEQEERDAKTGELVKIENNVKVTRKRKKYEPNSTRPFRHDENPDLDEIYYNKPITTNYQNIMRKLTKEDDSKLKYLHNFTEKEKKAVMQVNEDDKFIFKLIDQVIEELNKKFKNYSKDYIFDALVHNCMNLGRTYFFLSKKREEDKLSFTKADDNIILNMKDSEEYKNLVKAKGIELVQEREEFLKKK